MNISVIRDPIVAPIKSITICLSKEEAKELLNTLSEKSWGPVYLNNTVGKIFDELNGIFWRD